jgi:hypothetical protein
MYALGRRYGQFQDNPYSTIHDFRVLCEPGATNLDVEATLSNVMLRMLFLVRSGGPPILSHQTSPLYRNAASTDLTKELSS